MIDYTLDIGMIDTNGKYAEIIIKKDKNSYGRMIATVYDGDESVNTALHIVACVNYCRQKGISADELENKAAK